MDIGSDWSTDEKKKVVDSVIVFLKYTPLMIARACGHSKVAEVLERPEYCCEVDRRNRLGQTATDLQEVYEEKTADCAARPLRCVTPHQYAVDGKSGAVFRLQPSNGSRPSSKVSVYGTQACGGTLDRAQMKALLDDMRSQLPKSTELALHFTIWSLRDMLAGTHSLRVSRWSACRRVSAA